MKYYWCYLDAVFTVFVENSILYKKDIQYFCIGAILFSENKITRSVVSGKVDGQFYLVPGVRKRKLYLVPGVKNGKIYLVANDSYEKFYLAVKGLSALNKKAAWRQGF